MFRTLLATFALCLSLQLCAAQSATPAGTAQSSSDTAAMADPTVTKPTTLLAPALDGLATSVRDTHLEHWSRGVRDETDSNLRSIERDLQTTLPPLLQTADAAPASIAASFTVLRNLDALVAVLLRVTLTARGTAPQSEAEALKNSLGILEGARRSLGDQIEQLATAQEKQIADLQTTLRTQAASLAAAKPAEVAPKLPAPVPPAKPKRPRKAVAKPKPAPAQGPQQPATPPAKP